MEKLQNGFSPHKRRKKLVAAKTLRRGNDGKAQAVKLNARQTDISENAFTAGQGYGLLLFYFNRLKAAARAMISYINRASLGQVNARRRIN